MSVGRTKMGINQKDRLVKKILDTQRTLQELQKFEPPRFKAEGKTIQEALSVSVLQGIIQGDYLTRSAIIEILETLLNVESFWKDPDWCVLRTQ